jgi:hypothetical protein
VVEVCEEFIVESVLDVSLGYVPEKATYSETTYSETTYTGDILSIIFR